MKPNNPFLITGYHSPEFFCNRKRETNTLITALGNGRDITLVAPRRMGKTGLIKNVFYGLHEQQRDIVTFYMDIYSTQCLADFVRLFAGTVLGKLDSTPQKAMNRISRFMKSCRPVLSFDELTGAPKVTIDVTPATETATLKEIFDYLQSSEKQCYLAIDEFQQIAEYPEKGIEALLRSYIQFIPNLRFVFAGSKQHVMQEMFFSAKRPFYQSTQILSIDRIDRNEYYGFASAFFNKQGRPLPQETFDYLFDQFEGHTWYIQAILNRLYSYTHPNNNAWVEYAVEEIVNESGYVYELLTTAYSSSAIRLLKAIAIEKCIKEINAGAFISQYKLKAASSVNGSLKKLINNELVYKTPEGYIVYDRFLAIWLRRQSF